MDMVCSANGGLLRIGPGQWQVEPLDFEREDLGSWVVAYSGEPKDTMSHLKRCKTARLELLRKLNGDWDKAEEGLSGDERMLLNATLVNRNTERMASQLWRTGKGESSDDDASAELGQKLGALMTQHHEALAGGLGLSTPKIESMKRAALEAGSWGFKVVGSGGGGCVVAWCPAQLSETVSNAMKQANESCTETWIISKPSAGASIQK